jgi:hypothetical protein
MPSGEMGVSYVLGLAGTKDQVPVLQKEVEGLISELKSEGKATGEAESLSLQSTVAYAKGRYSGAEQYVNRAKTAVDDLREVFHARETNLSVGGIKIKHEGPAFLRTGEKVTIWGKKHWDRFDAL